MDDNRVHLQVTGDSEQAQSAIDAVRRDVQSLKSKADDIKPLSNELRGLTASFAAGETDRAKFIRDLGHIRTEALEAAQGLSRTGDEYVQLQQVAARATREIERANNTNRTGVGDDGVTGSR